MEILGQPWYVQAAGLAVSLTGLYFYVTGVYYYAKEMFPFYLTSSTNVCYHSGMGNRSTSDPFYQELGKALKKARLDADLTYSEAAASAGLSSSNAIGRYENATRTPSPKTIAALSVSYNMNSHDILANALEAASQVREIQNAKRKEKGEEGS